MKVPAVQLVTLRNPIKVGDHEVVLRIKQGDAVIDLTKDQAIVLGDQLGQIRAYDYEQAIRDPSMLTKRT